MGDSTVSPGNAALLVEATWIVAFVVLYLGFGGRMPIYRYPARMIVAGMLAFIVAMVLAFVLSRSAPWTVPSACLRARVDGSTPWSVRPMLT